MTSSPTKISASLLSIECHSNPFFDKVRVRILPSKKNKKKKQFCRLKQVREFRQVTHRLKKSKEISYSHV